MKKLRKYCVWILLSVILQTALLYYISKYYLKESVNVNFTPVKTSTNTNNKLTVNINKNASNVKLSYSANFAFYTVNSKLHVLNLLTAKDNEVSLKDDLDNYYFKWQDYQDKIIVSQKVSDNVTGIKMYQYDPRDNELDPELDANNESRIYSLARSYNVSDIKVNVNTIAYVKASTKSGYSKIYRLDISSGMDNLNLKVNTIGEYQIIKSLSDELIYEDSETNRIYSYSSSEGSERLKVSDVPNARLKLLYIDKNDNIYVGNLVGKNIDTIYYKEYSSETWNSIKLNKAVDVSNIYVLNDGSIYTIDKEKKYALNVKSNKKTAFEGSFVDMNTNGILSMHNGKLIRIKLRT